MLTVLVMSCAITNRAPHATTRYVDQDNAGCSDASSGASDKPYCTVEAAFRDLRSGDTLRVRDSRRPYNVSAVSAQPGPITVEADPGHHPVLTKGASEVIIKLVDVSDWTIQNLTFDGAQQEVEHAILVDARTRNANNIRIQRNRFVNLGGFSGVLKKPMAVVFAASQWDKDRPEAYPFGVTDSTIADNVFDNCAHGGVVLKHTRRVTVEKNKMVNFRCGHYRDGRIGVQAVKVEFSSMETTIRGNRIGDFQPSAVCPLKPGKNPKHGRESRAKYVGVYCDVGPQKGMVRDNIIFNIDPGREKPAPNNRGDSIGVFIESRCTDWNIENNLIYNIGTHAFRNGSPSTGFADRTAFMHNTVYNIAGDAIYIRKGEGLKIKYNIISNYNGVAINFINYSKCQRDQKKCRITDQTEAFHQKNHDINHNMFWSGANAHPIGIWFNRKTALDLKGWHSATGGYDQQSMYMEPKFIDARNGNFLLYDSKRAPSSKAVDRIRFGYQPPES